MNDSTKNLRRANKPRKKLPKNGFINTGKFETIKIKASIAKKFKRYCKNISSSQSRSLSIMWKLFLTNGISPEESLGPNFQTLEYAIKKRINGVIAIVRDIEKSQTKPTTAILQALLEQAEPVKKPLILEKKVIEEMNRQQQNQNKETKDFH